MNACSENTKQFVLNFLSEISLEIENDSAGEITFANNDLYTYLMYMRISEYFNSIATLLQSEQLVVAASLLRPLSETFILMKASIEDKDFNSKYLNHSVKEKRKWINKIISNHTESAFPSPIEHFEKLGAEIDGLKQEADENMGTTLNLFKSLGHMDMYLQLYSPGNMYLHTNLQSLGIYLNKENFQIVPHEERNYKGLYYHTGFGAAYIYVHSYSLLCQMLQKQTACCEKLFAKLKKIDLHDK